MSDTSKPSTTTEAIRVLISMSCHQILLQVFVTVSLISCIVQELHGNYVYTSTMRISCARIVQESHGNYVYTSTMRISCARIVQKSGAHMVTQLLY